MNLARAAFPADEAPRLREINEGEARGRAYRFEGHDSIVLAGAVRTPDARGLDALGAKIGGRRRGGVRAGAYQNPPVSSDAYRANVGHKATIGEVYYCNSLILLALPRGLEPLFSP